MTRATEGFRQWFAQSEPSEWISQGIALIGAALGVTSFLYKEWIAPATAPVNINLKTELRPLRAEAQPSTKKDQLNTDHDQSSVVLKITVTNPGARKIEMVKPFWMLLGRRGKTNELGSGDDGSAYAINEAMAQAFNTSVQESLDSGTILTSPFPTAQTPADNKDKPSRNWELIAVGPLFSNQSLESRQTISSEKAIFFPANRYDIVDAKVTIPSAPSNPTKISTGILTKIPRMNTFASQIENRWCYQSTISELATKGSQLTPHDVLSLFSLERYPSKEDVDPETSWRKSRFCPPIIYNAGGSTGKKDKRDRRGNIIKEGGKVAQIDYDFKYPGFDQLLNENAMRPSPKEVGAQDFATQQQSPVTTMTRLIK